MSITIIYLLGSIANLAIFAFVWARNKKNRSIYGGQYETYNPIIISVFAVALTWLFTIFMLFVFLYNRNMTNGK